MGIFTRLGRPFKNELTVLEQIGKWFFAPLLAYRPEDLSKEAFLEGIFHIKERSITKYRVLTSFKTPGLYVETPNAKFQGAGYRKVKRGSVVFVRHDATQPHVYQMSFMGGPGGKEQVYELSASEWKEISSKLRELTR